MKKCSDYNNFIDFLNQTSNEQFGAVRTEWEHVSKIEYFQPGEVFTIGTTCASF